MRQTIRHFQSYWKQINNNGLPTDGCFCIQKRYQLFQILLLLQKRGVFIRF